MTSDVSPVPLAEIAALRDLYRQEMNCQIVHDSLHERGFTESYLVRANEKVVGYGALIRDRAGWKDTIKEFYVFPAHRAHALEFFRQFALAARVARIEAQTNDRLLTLMLFDCATTITSRTILFHDELTTHLVLSGVTFRKATEEDRPGIFPHTVEGVGDWLVEAVGEIVATGGILFHYNVPYGDIYMEVAERFRRRGFGSYLVQE